MSLYARLAALVVILVALAGAAWKLHHSGYVEGKAEVRLAWDASVSKQRAAALAEEQANAAESARRIKAQQENDHAQEKLLAAARADAARNAADADRLRAMSADAARHWRDALNNSPTSTVCQAAGAAIMVSAELFERANRAANELADYADRSRIAGDTCAGAYQALIH